MYKTEAQSRYVILKHSKTTEVDVASEVLLSSFAPPCCTKNWFLQMQHSVCLRGEFILSCLLKMHYNIYIYVYVLKQSIKI